MPYQPSAPQQLPQLQARPDLSGAQALQTVGETIEKLGAMGADYLRYRKAATTAAATEAADQWEQDQMLNRGQFEQDAVGSNVFDARESYFEKLYGDTSKYEADLNSAARAEFKKRVDFKRKDFLNSADIHAKKQHDRYIVDVSKTDLDRAENDLAMFLAAKDPADVELLPVEPYGRIFEAAQSLSTVLGVDAMKLAKDSEYAARYKAMAQLSKIGSDEQIVRYYESNKGSFGPNELAAEQVTNESRKNIDANQAFSDIVPLASDLSGNFSPEVAYSQDISDLSPDVQAKVNKKIADYAAADWKKREEIGKFAVNEYEMAQIDGSVTTLENKPEFQAAVKRMTPEHLQALKYRQFAGPKESHPDDLLLLRVGENASSNTVPGAWYDTVPLDTLRITRDEKIRIMQNRQERASKDENRVVKDVALSIWSDNGRRRLPSFERGKTTLSPEAAKEFDDYSEFAESLIKAVEAKQIDKKNIEQMRAAARELKMTFDQKAPGFFGGGTKQIPLYQASKTFKAPGVQEMQAANIPASASPDEAALLWEAYNRSQTKAQAGTPTPEASRPTSILFSSEPIGKPIPLFGYTGVRPVFNAEEP
jgi:hypothetical protein